MKPVISKSHSSTKYFYDTIILLKTENEELVLDIGTDIGQFKIVQGLAITYRKKIRVFRRNRSWIIFPLLYIAPSDDNEGKWIDEWQSSFEHIDTLDIVYKKNKWMEEV